jgi:multicomponent Na+:H+ antiporter subunit B
LRILPLITVLLVGALLIWSAQDMPDMGDPNAPTNLHVAPYYIEHSEEEVGVENIVSAILADYRGYDTLGETTVIFTAGVSVLLLLRRRED